MSKLTSEQLKQVVIVRSKWAGVNVGIIETRKGDEVALRHSHKIYQWLGANTLHELARNGASMTEYTRISEEAPGLVTVLEVCELLECTPEAAANLTTPRWL